MFWSLVKHEARWRMGRRKRNTFFHRWDWLIYIVLLILVGIVSITFLASSRVIDPQKMYYLFTMYPIVLFILAFGQFSNEWRKQTFGWWLSLPYSRQVLMNAKFVAVLWKGFVILIGLLIATILIFYYLLFIDVRMQPIEPSLFLLSGCKWFVFLLCSNPLVISVGLLFSVLWHSIYRTATLIVWVLFWLLYTILSFNNLWDHFNRFFIASWAHVPLLLTIVAVSWAISYGLLCWSAYLLQRKLNL